MKPDIINKAFVKTLLTPFFQSFWYFFVPALFIVLLEILSFFREASIRQAKAGENLFFSLIILLSLALLFIIIQKLFIYFSSILKIAEFFLGPFFKYLVLLSVSLLLIVLPLFLLLNKIILNQANSYYWVLFVWIAFFSLLGGALFILRLKKFPDDSLKVQFFSALLSGLFLHSILINDYLNKISPKSLIHESFFLYLFYWLCILLFYFYLTQALYRPPEKKCYFDFYPTFLKDKIFFEIFSISVVTFIIFYRFSYFYTIQNFFKSSGGILQLILIYLSFHSLWILISSSNPFLRQHFKKFSTAPGKILFFISMLYLVILILFLFYSPELYHLFQKEKLIFF